MFQGTETSLTVEVGDQFEDDTQNDGFGDLGATPGHYIVRTFSGDSGYNREVIVAYDTTDEQEFLAVGLKFGSSVNDQSGFTVFKDTDGRWCFNAGALGFSYDNVLNYWTGTSGPYDTDPSVDYINNGYLPFQMSSSIANGSTGHPNYAGEIQVRWKAANPALYAVAGGLSRLGNYSLYDGGTKCILETGYYNSAVGFTV